MTVKELVKILENADPNGFVCVEINNVPYAEKVVEYKNAKGESMLYICDDTDYIDSVIDSEYVKNVIS